YFENPLLLMQVRPQLEAGFGRVPGGAALLQRLLAGVKAALLHGLPEIFFWSAVIMTASILLHLILEREPLRVRAPVDAPEPAAASRSEEHTSELQSLRHLVCRLLLEKKKVKMSTVESKAMPRRNGERRRAPTPAISKKSPAISGLFLFARRRPIRPLHSFPTRRSSDLVIMTASILLHLILEREPLRVRAPVDAPEPAAAS